MKCGLQIRNVSYQPISNKGGKKTVSAMGITWVMLFWKALSLLLYVEQLCCSLFSLAVSEGCSSSLLAYRYEREDVRSPFL